MGRFWFALARITKRAALWSPVAILVNDNLLGFCSISGASMRPTLNPGDLRRMRGIWRKFVLAASYAPWPVLQQNPASKDRKMLTLAPCQLCHFVNRDQRWPRRSGGGQQADRIAVYLRSRRRRRAQVKPDLMPRL